MRWILKQDIKKLSKFNIFKKFSGKNTFKAEQVGLKVSFLTVLKQLLIIACPELYYFILENQMVEASLLFGGFDEVQTNFATLHEDLIKSEVTTSTFSEALSQDS